VKATEDLHDFGQNWCTRMCARPGVHSCSRSAGVEPPYCSTLPSMSRSPTDAERRERLTPESPAPEAHQLVAGGRAQRAPPEPRETGFAPRQGCRSRTWRSPPAPRNAWRLRDRRTTSRPRSAQPTMLVLQRPLHRRSPLPPLTGGEARERGVCARRRVRGKPRLDSGFRGNDDTGIDFLTCPRLDSDFPFDSAQERLRGNDDTRFQPAERTSNRTSAPQHYSRALRKRNPPVHSGTKAVASISRRARGSSRPATTTSVIGG
jgi:hypothetical protein